MKIKVSHNSVELKLTLEEVDELQDIAEGEGEMILNHLI